MTNCNDIESKYSYILETSNPDKKYEFFWLGFKDSVNNWLNVMALPNGKKFKDELTQISEEFNQLQSVEKYNEILIGIQKYLIYVGTQLFLKQNPNNEQHYYHFQIYMTNLKRWKKWSERDLIPDKPEKDITDEEKNIKIGAIYINIGYGLIKKKQKYVTELNIISNYQANYYDHNLNQLYKLLDIGLQQKNLIILREINKIISVFQYANEKDLLECAKTLKSLKMMKIDKLVKLLK